ncbi:FAD-dependent oxidoreductase [Streptomyces sp. DSM 44915]|uniref:FAD-dependent oxidoreductase n=1 Tax=Streptomyces chisholmiae TaxID=3075540 RepID=A0ABU2JUC0_9ACTN|nr:FAD-dependent oxidoreductase [Streptomyces sp. DSM 44915]MDT0268586.1 FAD-dependent oxidoreductase [Streptomyces sp. DSM 44915]
MSAQRNLLTVAPATDHRDLRTQHLHADTVIVGGGLAGTCAAITAARAGARVVLVQDRPVLGGNASSEIRLWALGASAQSSNNNRWAREGGVLDEILVENTFRNPEGNAVLFDTVLLEKVSAEPNITLLLNTAATGATKDGDRIRSVTAFCAQDSTRYELTAPVFCDASGDGVLGYLAGAAYRMGAEGREEFGELFAPEESYGALLGQSIYFYSKDVGAPVRFTPPSYALPDITEIPRWRSFNTAVQGCRLWWIEYGGRLDTVHDTERIKWELWKVVYGVWNHLKNSGDFPEADTLTLEWVGLIPGKRESRRFEGLHMLRQQDIVEQRTHPDAISSGGWSMDLHPADGVFSAHDGSSHLHARGVYQIPYRCAVSRDVPNLLLAGRIISVTHVAFASTRVMATCAQIGQAVGLAAARCARDGLLPADLVEPERMRALQRDLLRTGQHIPGLSLDDPDDLARQATLTASSELRLAALPADGPPVPLDRSRAQLLPLAPGPVPRLTLTVDVTAPTTLRVEIRTGGQPDDYTPDVVLATRDLTLDAGAAQRIEVDVPATLDTHRYAFLVLRRNDDVSVRTTTQRVTGLLAVAHTSTQEADPAIGRPRVEFWTPERRPGGRNLALTIDPPLAAWPAASLGNGHPRPTARPNAWAAAPDDDRPTAHLRWAEPRRIARLELGFDTDFDHPMESVLWGHPERAMPFCVRHYRVRAGDRIVAERTDNHQTRDTVTFEPPIETAELSVEVVASHGATPPAIFAIRCY